MWITITMPTLDGWLTIQHLVEDNRICNQMLEFGLGLGNQFGSLKLMLEFRLTSNSNFYFYTGFVTIKLILCNVSNAKKATLKSLTRVMTKKQFVDDASV